MLIETLFLRLFEPDQSQVKEIVQEIVNIHNGAIFKNKTRGERRVKRQQERCKGRRSQLRVGTLNIRTMTGRGRELQDMMEQRNVDILCLQETKWKGSKARSKVQLEWMQTILQWI